MLLNIISCIVCVYSDRESEREREVVASIVTVVWRERVQEVVASMYPLRCIPFSECILQLVGCRGFFPRLLGFPC